MHESSSCGEFKHRLKIPSNQLSGRTALLKKEHVKPSGHSTTAQTYKPNGFTGSFSSILRLLVGILIQIYASYVSILSWSNGALQPAEFPIGIDKSILILINLKFPSLFKAKQPQMMQTRMLSVDMVFQGSSARVSLNEFLT